MFIIHITLFGQPDSKYSDNEGSSDKTLLKIVKALWTEFYV